MKNIIFAALILMAGAFPAFGGSDIDFDAVKKEGDVIQEKTVDLDGDGTPEKVVLKAYCLAFCEKELMSYAGQLTVQKKAGDAYKTIWEGPKIADNKMYEEEKFRFIFGPGGLESLEIIGDVYGDGAVRLFSPSQKSDVSPVNYRVYVWKGGKFEFEKIGYLSEDKDASGKFTWHDERDDYKAWILHFDKFEGPGKVNARVHKYKKDHGGSGGRALLEMNKDGATIVKWLEAMKKD